MPWRGDYYYWSVRVNGLPRKEYVGRGPDAELIARLEHFEAEARELQRHDWQVARQEAEALEAQLGQLHEQTELLTAAAMAAAGYHRHHRGEWRRRRGRD